MRSLHVFIDLADGHDEVDIKMVDHVDDEAQGNDEARVLEVCELDVHCAELDAPPDIRILRWWWLESE